MADLIDRQTAIETAIEAADKWDGGYSSEREGIIRKFFDKVPAVQPDHTADIGKKAEKEDCISRQAAIDLFPNDALEWDTKGGYIAPHLARRMIEELPAAQPDHNADIGKKAEGDCISRKTALDALAKQMPRSYTPDGSHPADEEIYKAQEIYVDCIESIEILPAVQPEIIRCKDCDWWTKQKDSLQGRCELMQMYPTGGWYCGNARRRGGETE